jgi:glycosyltransferase involved in cell wall biosynthesis
MKLLIISHTEHYKDSNGQIVGWGPTLTEINHLATIFEEIYHIGTFRNGIPPLSAMPYTVSNVHFIGMPFTGGVYWYQKLDILWNAPATIYKVFKTLQKVDVFQLRCPTGIGVYLIPLLTVFSAKKGWYKYAGNWVQKKAPFGYAIQRWILKKQRRKVTINGRWKDQPSHCYTFENPCLTEEDLVKGKGITKNKEFRKPFEFCFAGRLEDDKGVGRIIEAFMNLKDTTSVKALHLIGDSVHRERYERLVKGSPISFIFHGFKNFYDVFEIYKKSHFFLLPSSASEGFPKVIAEAMNFGCIPIVSNVSSIGQYVKSNKNGFVLIPNTAQELEFVLNKILKMDIKELNSKKKHHSEVSALFTYERYIERIKNEIIN